MKHFIICKSIYLLAAILLSMPGFAQQPAGFEESLRSELERQGIKHDIGALRYILLCDYPGTFAERHSSYGTDNPAPHVHHFNSRPVAIKGVVYDHAIGYHPPANETAWLRYRVNNSHPVAFGFRIGITDGGGTCATTGNIEATVTLNDNFVKKVQVTGKPGQAISDIAWVVVNPLNDPYDFSDIRITVDPLGTNACDHFVLINPVLYFIK